MTDFSDKLIDTLDKGFSSIWDKMHILHLENRDFLEKLVEDKVATATTKILTCVTHHFEALAKDYVRDWESDQKFHQLLVEKLTELQEKVRRDLGSLFTLLMLHDNDSEVMFETIHSMLMGILEIDHYPAEALAKWKPKTIHNAQKTTHHFFEKEKANFNVTQECNHNISNSVSEHENCDVSVPHHPEDEPKLEPIPLERQETRDHERLAVLEKLAEIPLPVPGV